MARLRRLYAPDLPHLAQARFAAPLAQGSSNEVLDRIASWLADESRMHGVAIHGWVLTLDQLLLLATPAGPAGLSGLLQSIGRRLAAQLRSGRVYAGRFRSTLIEPGQWVLPSLIWLETLPLRQGLVNDAEHWNWSSAALHTGSGMHGPVSDHADYWACGNTPFDRQANYRARLLEGLPPVQGRRIDQALQGQWALGGDAFVADLGTTSTRRPVAARRGRPRKPQQPDVDAPGPASE
jgi:putative transposase